MAGISWFSIFTVATGLASLVGIVLVLLHPTKRRIGATISLIFIAAVAAYLACHRRSPLDRPITMNAGTRDLRGFLDDLQDANLLLDAGAATEMAQKYPKLRITNQAFRSLSLKHVLDDVLLPQLPIPLTYEVDGQRVTLKRRRQ